VAFADMTDDIAEVLFDEDAIARRVRELAATITADYAGSEVLLLATLKGAVIFLADLMRALQLPVCVDFVGATSYGGSTESSGSVRLDLDSCGDMSGRHVLIVEDIVDTGRTLTKLVDAIQGQAPASVRTCCLLDKPSRRVTDFRPDYVGFEIADRFVVGYGLDFSQRYRNLPYIAVLKPRAYES